MVNVTVIGAGNMGSAISSLATSGGHDVQLLSRDRDEAAAANPAAKAGVVGDPITGDVVVLALPYPAIDEVLSRYDGQLDGKVLVDISNPLDFETFDSLVVPADGSAAAEIAAKVPGAKVLKAFNTTFAATLATGTVGGLPTTVQIAGDDAGAKSKLAEVLDGTGVRTVDAGSLKRARELEALGFLQLTLAAQGKTQWTSGFALAG
jgi:predicted dinucleotide-binding enzyme